MTSLQDNPFPIGITTDMHTFVCACSGLSGMVFILEATQNKGPFVHAFKLHAALVSELVTFSLVFLGPEVSKSIKQH